MLQIGKYKFEGKKEIALYVVCTIASLFTLINFVIPGVLGVDPFLNVPMVIAGPFYLTGIFTMGTLAILAFFMLLGSLIERSSPAAAMKKRDLFRLIARDAGLLAPNLDEVQRAEVIECLRAQLSSGEISKAFALLEEGEAGCQMALVLTDKPKQLRNVWNDLADGATIISPQKLMKRYAVDSPCHGLEIVWD